MSLVILTTMNSWFYIPFRCPAEIKDVAFFFLNRNRGFLFFFVKPKAKVVKVRTIKVRNL